MNNFPFPRQTLQYHIRSFVAHCYLPLTVVSMLVPVYLTVAYFIDNPKRHPFSIRHPGATDLPPVPRFHSTTFRPSHTLMPIAIPTLKRKPNEDDDILTKRRNEAMVHMARLAYERMRRIDEEDHERGLKEQQYNNSVKYQRMVEYELNNPGETATVRLDQFYPVSSIMVQVNPHPRLCVTGST